MSRRPAKALFDDLRNSYHAKLLATILYADGKGIASNADKDSAGSVRLAKAILEKLRVATGWQPGRVVVKRLAGQKAGREFEKQTAEFIRASFGHLAHLRPGTWHVLTEGSSLAIANYEQYSHLFELGEAARRDPNLAVVLGSDYVIKPDVIVFREPEDDKAINAKGHLVDSSVTKLSSLRKSNGGKDILHASISCKWTLRSDRAQNARSEALNLIRSRKGRAPHIICVTGEPTPARLASIALGTGDIDCVYHFALNELLEAVAEHPNDDTALDLLRIMVNGRRLKDIADLPLDLAV